MRGKISLPATTWTAAILLALAFPGSYHSQGGPPNLRPYQPEGWTDLMVVSTRTGTNSDARRLTTSDRLYVDFAVINDGGSAVDSSFRIDLFLDGLLWDSFHAPAHLEPRTYRFQEDYLIRRLGPGTHTLRIVADADGAVAESNESDNEYTRTLFVTGDCIPLTVRVSPRSAGTVIPGREPNCAEATVSISSLPARRGNSGGQLGLGGEPIVEARRSRAFAALKGKVRSDTRVRVIVGLRIGRQPASTSADRSGGSRRRPVRIAQPQQSLMIRMSGHNLSSVRQFKFMPYLAMEVDEAALEALESDPEVVSIEEDLVVRPRLEDSTALIGAPQAWSQGYAGSGQTIAVIDTGVDGDHPFLAEKVVSEACYSESFCPEGVRESILPGSGKPCPSNFSDCFHGTAIAGIAAGYGEEFSGVAREAQIIAVQVFSQCGDDCINSSDSDWVAGLERVMELSTGFDIAAVNMSFGAFVSAEENCDTRFPAIKSAMDNLLEIGITPVAASGNEGSSKSINFPACISGVVSVGSVDGIGNDTTPELVSSFSNSSPLLDLLAPGRGINTSFPGDGFDSFNGTSLSTPHVAGAWAVLRSKAPNATLPELLSLLERTGIPVTDSRNGLVKPLMQLDAALEAALPNLSYSSGTHLTLTATPNPGFRFTLWRGCDDTSDNRCVVSMDGTKSVSAVFESVGSDHPDLTLTSLTAPRTATIGGEVFLAAGIRNRGSVDASTFRVSFYLSEDPDITIDDTWFAACNYEAGLAAGRSESCSRPFPIPQRIVPGRYYLGAIADDLDRVAESRETNNVLASGTGPIEILDRRISSRSFVPVILSAEGRNNSYFTSELTLTNRAAREARLDYTFTADEGGGSGTASDTLAPGQQKIESDAMGYLRRLGVPVRGSGNRIGTLVVDALASDGVGVLVRTTTDVPEGRAGLAYPGVAEKAGFNEQVYLCGLRQTERDRSNVAFQNMGTMAEGPITLRTTVFSGDPGEGIARVLGDVTLGPGEFHQYSPVLGTVDNGYVRVERVDGTAPFYAYGVINDQTNSDGSFVFPVTADSLEGSRHQTLPVIVETREFTSELTVTNFSEEEKTLQFSFLADGLTTPDRTARFSLTLGAGEQRIILDFIETELRQKGVQGVRSARGGLAGALFASVENGEMNGIVIGARTSSSDGRGGRYGVFYNAVPDGAALTGSAWVDSLQQDSENRSNLALVNTGEVDDSPSVFSLEVYSGETGQLVRTITKTLPARGWHQINGILGTRAQDPRQGYVRIRQISGNNPFLAYGVVNDGGAPGERSGDGAYVPARE